MNKNSVEFPNHYFWLGIFGIITLVVILIPALIGIEPNKDGSMPVVCRIYAWLLLAVLWSWTILFLLLKNESIINKLRRMLAKKVASFTLAYKLAELLYIIILIYVSISFFNPIVVKYVSNYALLAI